MPYYSSLPHNPLHCDQHRSQMPVRTTLIARRSPTSITTLRGEWQQQPTTTREHARRPGSDVRVRLDVSHKAATTHCHLARVPAQVSEDCHRPNTLQGGRCSVHSLNLRDMHGPVTASHCVAQRCEALNFGFAHSPGQRAYGLRAFC